jgi:hypothetical protein
MLLGSKKWVVFNDHVYPLEDLKGHDDENCWCKPVVNEDGLIVHNSMDKREFYEYKLCH